MLTAVGAVPGASLNKGAGCYGNAPSGGRNASEFSFLFRNFIEHTLGGLHISQYYAVAIPAALLSMISVGDVVIEINVVEPPECIRVLIWGCGSIARIIAAQANHVQLLQSLGGLEMSEIVKRQLAILAGVAANRTVGTIADLICSVARDIDDKAAV